MSLFEILTTQLYVLRCIALRRPNAHLAFLCNKFYRTQYNTHGGNTEIYNAYISKAKWSLQEDNGEILNYINPPRMTFSFPYKIQKQVFKNLQNFTRIILSFPQYKFLVINKDIKNSYVKTGVYTYVDKMFPEELPKLFEIWNTLSPPTYDDFIFLTSSKLWKSLNRRV